MTPRILRVPAGETLPPLEAVLEGQGIPAGTAPDARTAELARRAVSLYAEKAHPAGILLEISRSGFRGVFEGEGRNDEESPVGPILRAAGGLALFAATVGEEVCREISRLFREQDFALGSMLDSAASEGAERTARAMEETYRRQLREAGLLGEDHGTLRFSPGYCGWDISGQRALFEALGPQAVGITLNASFLMQPLKSVSGVILAGRREIFEFDDVFSFCADCATHECRDRIRSLYRPPEGRQG